MIKSSQSELLIGGVTASGLAKKFGTPLYVYGGDKIRGQYQKLIEAIPYSPLSIHYSCKVNENPKILKLLQTLGSGIECVSRGEVEQALNLGFAPADIIFTCGYIDQAELRFVINSGAAINLDSLNQLEWYGQYRPGGSVSLRVNQGIGAGHHRHVITGGPNSKFGIDITQLGQAREIADRYKLKITGLQQHIGSNILDAHVLLTAAEALIKTAESLPAVTILDFGGGLGVPYQPGETPLNINAFGKELATIVKALADRRDQKIKLVLEPGRYLVAEAGVLLAKVTDIKQTPYKKFVGLNTGFNHLVRPILYDAYHEIVNTSKLGGEAEIVTIAGNLCEAGDVLARDRAFAKATVEGDIVAIMNAGSAGYAMSSNYNLRPKPAEVLIDRGRVVKL